ncbi:MAG TPA: CHAD domain-containing protein [Crinalium sp.]|jgi:CHAD domain-containing protein
MREANGASARGIVDVEVKRSLTLGEFAHDIIAEQYRRFSKQEKKVLADKDPEHLHQMRVAIRRLRTALRIFAAAIDLPKAAGDKRLRHIARELGQLRDLDVQIATLKDDYRPRLSKSEKHLLEEGLDALHQKRRKAFSSVAKLLDHSSYHHLKTAYETWLECPSYQLQAQFPLSSILPDLLNPIVSNLLLHPGWFVSVDPLSPDNAPTLHDLRKVFKQARYQAEFFASCYGDSFKAWIEEMKTLQDSLGKFQDGQVLLDLMADTLPHKAKLPELHAIIQQEQDAALSDWETVRQKYLSSDYRYKLHRFILEPDIEF